MNATHTFRTVTRQYARRIAVSLAIGGVAAAGAGFRAYSTANASEAPARHAPALPAPAPVAAVATPDTPALSRAGATAMATDSAATVLVSLGRETFAYGGQGRRDPFASLLKVGGDLRPLITDLRLVTVVIGGDGRNSVAIMRDLTTKEQYRRRTGESLGRMRIARIEPRQVVFTIEEFGYSRQEVLTYGDSTTMRTR